MGHWLSNHAETETSNLKSADLVQMLYVVVQHAVKVIGWSNHAMCRSQPHAEVQEAQQEG